MRRLRIAVVASVAGGAPVLLASMLDACGSDVDTAEQPSTPESSAPDTPTGSFSDAVAEPPPPPPPRFFCNGPRIVELPDAGTAATSEQLCATQDTAIRTNATARVTLTNYSASLDTATGFVTMPADVEALLIGMPSVSVVISTNPDWAMVASNMTKVAGGFRFDASWPTPLPDGCWGVGPDTSMTVAATFQIACEGGTKTVEARTRIDLCDSAGEKLVWVSSGDKCCDCTIIAEMAPSPIVSDKTADDLPLARVVRLRVLEVARAGRQVLLFAENDAGPELEIEWSVSEGSIERVAPDVVLWTLPDDPFARPFGQVAVWNEAGAAVENFQWGVA
jgi:hypothetical protein